MPFHPTCFEIYSRASRLRFGFVDANGLAGWRILDPIKFLHHPAVRRGEEQWWIHNPGDAWLAANPVLVPGLPALLESALSEATSKISNPELQQKDDFDEDPFSNLPKELVDSILDFLAPVDTASLRLAGCIQYLPLSHWQDVFQKDMPWIWEMWDDVKPSFWATVCFGAMRAEKEKREVICQSLQEQQLLHEAVLVDEMPGIWEDYKRDHPLLQVDPTSLTSVLFSDIPELSKYEGIDIQHNNGTNWCRAFYEISKHGEELKGIRNRKRIWEAVEEIIRRIKMYREQNQIVD